MQPARTTHKTDDLLPHGLNAEMIVHEMITTRAPGLLGSKLCQYGWPLAKLVSGYDNLIDTVDAWSKCENGSAMIDLMHRSMTPRVSMRNPQNLPLDGGAIVVSNHPTGLGDALAFYNVVHPFRKDVGVFVFYDLLKINPRATDAMIPVEWRDGHKSRKKTLETLRITDRIFKEGKVVTIFPSGRMSYWNGCRLKERAWQSSFIKLALKYRVPVVPVHIRARNSLSFYAYSQVSRQLRDMQYLREILNKKDTRYELTFGEAVPPEYLTGDAATVTERMRRYVEDLLPQNPGLSFRAFSKDDALQEQFAPKRRPALAFAASRLQRLGLG